MDIHHIVIFVLVVVVQEVICSKELSLTNRLFRSDKALNKSTEDFGLDTKYNICYLRVTNRSATRFLRMIQDNRPHFVKIQISFPPTVNYLVQPDILMANHIYWTFYITEGIFPYLKWPADFVILSLGLLDAKTLPDEPWLVFETYGRAKNNCSVRIGDYWTRQSMGFALKDFVKHYLSKHGGFERGYYYSYWCQLREIHDIKGRLGYYMALHFGLRIEAVEYVCEKTHFVSNIFYSVVLPGIKPLYRYTILSDTLAVVLYLFSPMLLFGVFGTILGTGIDIQSEQDGSRLHLITDDDEGEADDWVFLTGSPPISISTLLFGMCGLHRNHQTAVSRIFRFIFVFLSPLMIYVQLYVYYCYMYEYTMERIDHGIPLGYLTMLGGFWKSKQLFCPYLGGPYCLLVGYYILSVIFLIIPKSTDRVLLSGFSTSKWENVSPIFWSIEKIEKLSIVSIKSQSGYIQAYRQSVAGIYILFRPKFWCWMYMTQEKRIRRLFEHLRICCNSELLVVLCLPFLPVYIGLCLVECLLCVVYFGIPLFNCIPLIVKGFIFSVRNSIRSLERKCCANQSAGWFSRCVIYLFIALITMLFVYYVLCFCTVFISSFSFISQVIVFSFIALIVYPSVSFGYLFFGSVLLYYIVNMFQTVGSGYLELLADAVDISIDLQAEKAFPPSQRFGDHIRGNHVYTSTAVTSARIRTLNANTDLSVHDPFINVHSPPMITDAGMVKYREHTVGIPRRLFDHLVRKHRSVHIQIANAVIKLTLTCVLIGCTVSLALVKHFGASEGISEVMHVVFIVVIGALPRILEIALSKENHALNKEIKNRKIRASILQFWESREQRALVE